VVGAGPQLAGDVVELDGLAVGPLDATRLGAARQQRNPEGGVVGRVGAGALHAPGEHFCLLEVATEATQEAIQGVEHG